MHKSQIEKSAFCSDVRTSERFKYKIACFIGPGTHPKIHKYIFRTFGRRIASNTELEIASPPPKINEYIFGRLAFPLRLHCFCHAFALLLPFCCHVFAFAVASRLPCVHLEFALHFALRLPSACLAVTLRLPCFFLACCHACCVSNA